MNAPFVEQVGKRDLRLDVFRGLALLTIFINHVPGNALERWTSRNFGFSDAAEAFVLMSGIAVGIAYSKGFSAGRWLEASIKVWRRAGLLYSTHLVTTAMAIGLVAGGALFLGVTEMLTRINFAKLLSEPLRTMVGIPLLGHQLGYFNILPLYAVLLLVSPVYILVGLRSRAALIALATLIWLCAGFFRLNLPNYPNAGGWFFNPVAWQLIYAIGIAAGLGVTRGRPLLRYHPGLFWACVVYLVFTCLWVQLRMGSLPGAASLPFFIGGFDKTFLALPRLLHVLALAYVVINLPVLTSIFSKPVFKPVELIGRNGLAVFATGSVLAVALQILRLRWETNLGQDIVLIGLGIFLQYAVALVLSRLRPGRSVPERLSTGISSSLKSKTKIAQYETS